MFREHVSDKPVAAVIYTHTHIDHYGGVKGVVDVEDVASGKISIIAPGTIASFDKFAIGETSSPATRWPDARSTPSAACSTWTPEEWSGAALGSSAPRVPTSRTSLPRRNHRDRDQAGDSRDRVRVPRRPRHGGARRDAHLDPATQGTTCAENANHSLHNVQTLRGARTRDARNFARYLDETLERLGDDAEVHYGPHTWPVWGNAEVADFIESQRDTYKYIHDQALRLANKGYTPLEAAEVIELPAELGRRWSSRGYHGTLHHDVLAVFTKELGMWDGDPVSLHPHPPVDSARRYVDLIGAEKILTEGQRALDDGDYRWAVEILHKLVFAEPDNTAAKHLMADAYEQMGYQIEGPQWRGIFLSAALELREGAQPPPYVTASLRQHPGYAGRHPLRLRLRARHRQPRDRCRPSHRLHLHRPQPDLVRPGQARRAQRPAGSIKQPPTHRHRTEGRTRRRPPTARLGNSSSPARARSNSTATSQCSRPCPGSSTSSSPPSTSSPRSHSAIRLPTPGSAAVRASQR